jgi:hypothetical protein
MYSFACSFWLTLSFFHPSVLEEVESFIYDRMYQLGYDKSLFHKLDTKLTGFVTPVEFRAAVAQVGVALTDQELQAITQKFDPKADGTIK